MKLQPWKLLKETNVSPSKWLRVLQRDFVLPNGSEIDYFVTNISDGAFALVYDGEYFYMGRKFCPGSKDFSIMPYGGLIEEGEEPKVSCARELLVEAGIKAQKLEYIMDHYLTPVKGTGKIYYYFAQDASFVEKPEVLDEQEELELIKFTPKELLKDYKEGKFDSALSNVLIGQIYIRYPNLFS